MGPKRLKTLLPLHHAGRSNIHPNQSQKRGPYGSGSVSSSTISTSLINTSFISMPGTTAPPQSGRPKRPYTRRHTGSTSSTNNNGNGYQNVMAKIALVESQLNKRIDDLTSRQEVLEILYGSLEREMDGLTDLTKFVLNCVNSLFHGFIQVQQQLNFQHCFASQQSSSTGGNNVNVNNFQGHEGEGRPGPIPVPMSTLMMSMSSAPFPVPLTTSVAATDDTTKHGSTAGSLVGSPSPSASPSSSSSSVLHLNTNQNVENQSQIQVEVSDEESVINYCQTEIRDKTEGDENENVDDIEIEEEEDDNEEGKKQQPLEVNVDMDTVNAQIPKLNHIKHKRKQLYGFQRHKIVKVERPLMEVIQEYYELETSEENSDSSSHSSVVVSASTSVETMEAATGTSAGGGRRAAADCGDISSGDTEGQEGQDRGQHATAAMETELRTESTSILGQRLSSYDYDITVLGLRHDNSNNLVQHVCEFCLNGFRHKRNLMKHQIIIPMYCRRKRAKMAKSTMPTLRRNMTKGRNVIYQRGNIADIPPVLRINDNDSGENGDENERNNNSSSGSISNPTDNNVSNVRISKNDEENIAINNSRLSELGLGIPSDVGDKVRLQFGP